jgi:hypothetical protein
MARARRLAPSEGIRVSVTDQGLQQRKKSRDQDGGLVSETKLLKPRADPRIRQDPSVAYLEILHWWDMTTSAPRSGYNQVDLS